MPTLTRTVSRALIGGVAVMSLLAACGGDDDQDDVTTTTTEAPDDTGTDEGAASDLPTGDEVCEILTVAELNAATGEAFEDAEAVEGDACVYTDAGATAKIKLAVTDIRDATGDDDATAGGFLAQGEAGCDPDTVVDLEVAGADASLACEFDGTPTVVAVVGSTAHLLAGETADPAVTKEMIFTALGGLLEDII